MSLESCHRNAVFMEIQCEDGTIAYIFMVNEIIFVMYLLY